MVYERKALTLAEIRVAIDTVLDQAIADGDDPIAVAMTDERGALVGFARMDLVPELSTELAQRKAYTAALLRMDTSAIPASLASTQRTLSDFNVPRFIGFPGGVVIKADDRVIGALGVSGRKSADDEALARAGLAAAGLTG